MTGQGDKLRIFKSFWNIKLGSQYSTHNQKLIFWQSLREGTRDETCVDGLKSQRDPCASLSHVSLPAQAGAETAAFLLKNAFSEPATLNQCSVKMCESDPASKPGREGRVLAPELTAQLELCPTNSGVRTTPTQGCPLQKMAMLKSSCLSPRPPALLGPARQPARAPPLGGSCPQSSLEGRAPPGTETMPSKPTLSNAVATSHLWPSNA